MALTPSTMLPLGTPAPDFQLLEPATGRMIRRDQFQDAPALVVVFLCNHCPYVKHLREGLAQFGRECTSRGVALVAINSNDVVNYPADSPERMVEEARQAGWTFPYLFDADQAVARHYRAACTPDFYLFDAERKLAYRGQFDDSRPGNGRPVSGADLRTALEALLSGRPVPPRQLPSMGCNIKWKSGQAPEYLARP
jgi:peroxiredoxin